MVNVIPSTRPRTTKSRGEIAIFDKFISDKKYDWTILHSQDLLFREYKWMGEIDYVVIIPKKGIVCIEIKSCKEPYPKIKDSGWFYNFTQEDNNQPDIDGPFLQAKNNTQDLRKFIKNHSNDLRNIIFTRMIIFTDCPFNQKSAEWLEFEYVDKNDLGENYENIFKLINITIENFRDHCVGKDGFKWFDNSQSFTPSPEQIKKILKILRPNYENYISPENRQKNLFRELKKYTDEQFLVFDTISQNDRIIVNSPAGTGKTLLAIEMARRSFNNKQKTLFICYNNLLARKLREELDPIKEYVSFFTFHQLLLKISNIEIKNIENKITKDFWDIDLKNIVLKNIEASDYKNKFDHLIIDEAQDITTAENILILSYLLKNDLDKSKLSLFGDYDWQSIYKFKDNPDEFIDPLDEILDPAQIKKQYCSDISLIDLRINCRNSFGITKQAELLGGMNPPYKKILRPNDNIIPSIKKFKDINDQFIIIEDIIKSLKKQNYLDNEIIILSINSIKDSCIDLFANKKINNKNNVIYSYDKFDYNKKGVIFCSSIRSFKGLESSAVIIVDVLEETMLQDDIKALLYTGITRSIEKLFMLVKKA